MNRLAKQAEDLKENALFITTTYLLPSDRFVIVDRLGMMNPWGPSTLIIQRKLTAMELDKIFDEHHDELMQAKVDRYGDEK
jgi:hypothetical protein